MRRLIIILLFLIVSVWLGVEVVRHPGYMLLVYQPWMVQMPLWFAALSLLIIFGLFYILIDCIDRLSFLWFRIKNWLHIRREHKSYSKTQQGLASLIEGRWKKAEKLLIAGVSQSFEPLINYLAAARTAHEQSAFERRDQYIKNAYEAAPDAKLAIGLTQAELEVKQDKLEQATATLNHLRQQSPRHPRVLKLLEKIYVRLADWEHLKELLPSMRKAKMLTAKEYELFEKNIYCEILRNASGQRLSDVRVIWNQMPRYLRSNPDVVCEYVKQLALHAPVTGIETTKEMEDLTRKVLKTTWQPELVTIYGGIPFAQTNLNRQLVIEGAWLKLHGPHPEILLALGKLCVRVQLWGKAKDYFERCLAQGPNPEASLEYGKLLEQLGETEAAMEKYKEGLGQIATH
jgi:HemY protein